MNRKGNGNRSLCERNIKRSRERASRVVHPLTAIVELAREAALAWRLIGQTNVTFTHALDAAPLWLPMGWISHVDRKDAFIQLRVQCGSPTYVYSFLTTLLENSSASNACSVSVTR